MITRRARGSRRRSDSRDLEQGHRRPEGREVPRRGGLDVAPLALAHELGGIEQESPGHPDERPHRSDGRSGRPRAGARSCWRPGPGGTPSFLDSPRRRLVLTDVIADRRPVDGVRLLVLRRHRHDPSPPLAHGHAPCVLILLESISFYKHSRTVSPVVTELCLYSPYLYEVLVSAVRTVYHCGRGRSHVGEWAWESQLSPEDGRQAAGRGAACDEALASFPLDAGRFRSGRSP